MLETETGLELERLDRPKQFVLARQVCGEKRGGRGSVVDWDGGWMERMERTDGKSGAEAVTLGGVRVRCADGRVEESRLGR